MKRNILTLAVAAGLIASAGVASADPTVYGRLHLALESSSDGNDDGTDVGASGVNEDFDMNSRKSVFGVKGTEDLGNGLKAFYKAEWEIDPADGQRGAPTGTGTNDPAGAYFSSRDTFVGLKAGWGKVLLGTASSNYKQMGGKIDPFWHHAAEGRGYTNTMSAYHGGKGTDRGRMTNMAQYTTPKMAGIEVVVNYTLSGTTSGATTPTACSGNTGGGPGANVCGGDEVLGVGARWSNKSFLVFFDYLDPDEYGRGALDATNYTPADESVMKLGGKFTAKQFWVSAQYEMAEDQTGGDYMFVGANFDINKNNAIAATIGSHTDNSNGYAIGYTHKMSKQTKVYVDYSGRSDERNNVAAGNANDDSVIALGIVKSF
jgi:predicted porin